MTLALIVFGASLRASAQLPYSANTQTDYPRQVYWGDTHLHTNNSFDARALGVTLDADAAYRFARGEEITSSTGQAVRLSRPLDFLVVTDHSDAMGAIDQLIRGNELFLAHPSLRDARTRLMAGGTSAAEAVLELSAFLVGKPDDDNSANPLLNQTVFRSVWEQYLETADSFNDPGRFTAIIGYEWTPASGGDKLHRNVLYRGNAKQARQQLPFTAVESFNPQDLWVWMENFETRTGSKVLALAHSGNLSNGKMFPVDNNPHTSTPIDIDYVKNRNRWEPLYEVTQIKGDGEAHPILSPEDEFADFETWDRGNVTLQTLKSPDMLQYEYAREALKNGLALKQKLGTNPYRFGMVGSTDSHTALATAEESNFFGKFSGVEPDKFRTEQAMVPVEHERKTWQNWETSASGYAAVWASDNTREALFDAMLRREVYATTGPRITVRFFAGFDFSTDDIRQNHLVRIGYQKGVPMGGLLNNDPTGRKPGFLIAAQKDALGANLDRIQVVKGWLDNKGNTHEKIHNVAWSDAHTRKLKRNGSLPPVGNTVNLADASWSNAIGDVELATFWEDPDFNPSQPAFYYLRVLEIPTPRWPVFDAKYFGKDMPDELMTTIQERAYTAPIWYQP